MSSQAVMKRQILALAKREPSNEELQKIKQSLAVYKKLTKEEQAKINEMVTNAHAKLDSEGKFAKGGKTKTQSMKTALTEFKNKIGAKKFKRATMGTDIKKDIGIPAQKVGKRIVRKKGKTTNQYGTFKNQVGTTYYEGRPNRSDVNQPSEKRKIKLAKGGEVKEKSPKFKVGDKVYSYQNKSESAPIAYAKLSMWDRENGAHENDVWKYKLSLKDGYSNWINEESLSKTKMTTYAEGGEVSQYIDGLSKQEVLSKTIVYDNGGESYDRYTIFTPDGSVYGMSETAEGFNQYLGDSSEIEKGKHLGRKLRSVPKGIQGAVLDRMLDDEQMFAKGGKLSKEDALQKAIDMGVDFDKDFHAQSVGNELAELAKESGYKKSASSSGSTGRAFFYHLQKIYDKRKYAQGGKLSSKAKYIPKRDIAEIEVEKNGKSKSIDGANLLDGVYVKKVTKFADGGAMGIGSYKNHKVGDFVEVWQYGGKTKLMKIVGFEDGKEIYLLESEDGKTRSVTPKKYIANLSGEFPLLSSYEKHKETMRNAPFDEDTYPKGTEFAKGGKVAQKVFVAKEDGILGIFSGSDAYSIEISKGDTFVTFGEQDNSNWWYVKKVDKKPSTMSENNDWDYTKSKSRVNVNWDEMILTFPKGDNMIYAKMDEKFAKGGTIKKSLAEFKNKVGASKYREATRGVDIEADLQIPALKKGRRVVTTKGKTSNQYGTFKNQVGSVYYENRPNHYDVNQPSEKRKIKLAKGGMVFGAEKFWNELSVKEKMEWLKKRRDIPSDYKSSLKYDSFQNLPDWIKEKVKKAYTDNKIYKYAQGGTFANGGALEGAKIYVADLAEYNDGRLVGKWFDLSDYSDASELMGAIQEMLDEQTAKDKSGEVHEEWAVHDFEGFPRSFGSEYMGEKDFEKLYKIAEIADDRGIPSDVLMEAVADFGADEDQIEEIADAYYGSVSTNFGNEFKDFAYEYIDSIGSIADAVSNPDFYFDFESFGSDARMDYTDEELEEYGYDELDDTELGERLVDEMGGVDQLGQKTIEMYFDYDKFGRDLEYDFISVKGDDGDYYFFNRNW